MRVHDEIDDLVKRSFATSVACARLLAPGCADVLDGVLESRKRIEWYRLGDRSAMIRHIVLGQSPALLVAMLAALLAKVNLTLEDVDWRALDHRLMDYTQAQQGTDDHAGPED